ncbi:LysR family transcriptional regulator [Pseudomonas sp. CNPSo 3701]|uniref:LysR family transcriptional regulator n=1 Tax=Pseudomonas sp. CNPSo 3701 TaxID=3027943 RepID=UPI002363EB1E|nr:LysR family transcriptional regulator [Pseudomonas sp. CNPSo 3701]MDD1506807.1 LysR family transcriptional regulator [Pseudomonas sp. CNPSo 3701]
MSRPQDLTFFHLLAMQGNLAATARELGITPPAVSKRLAALEQRLGVRLVNRTTRSLGLTPEGEIYFRHAGRILGDIESLEELVTSSRQAPKGLLRINASLGFGRRHIGPALSVFLDRYPEVEAQLILSDHPMDLAANGLDLVIRFGSLPDARFHARRIASNRRLLCASPLYLERHGTPQRLQELSQHNCIFLRQNDSIHGVWEFLEGQRTRSVKVRSNLSCNDGEVALNWALEGRGILLRAEWDIARYVRSGRLRLILEDTQAVPADVYAIYSEQHHLSAKVRHFIDFLVERFQRIDHLDSGEVS